MDLPNIDPEVPSVSYWNHRCNPAIADLTFAIEDWVDEHALLHLKSKIMHGVTTQEAQRHDDLLKLIEGGQILLAKQKRATLN
jgi:hypothetical protein